MGQWIQLDTPHGTVAAWQIDHAAAPKGGLVVIQEIFGVNAHIREVAEGYAAEGYAVLAPAFFDPIQPGVELDYDKASSLRGRELVGQLGLDAALDIVASAAQHLRAHLGRPAGAAGHRHRRLLLGRHRGDAVGTKARTAVGQLLRSARPALPRGPGTGGRPAGAGDVPLRRARHLDHARGRRSAPARPADHGGAHVSGRARVQPRRRPERLRQGQRHPWRVRAAWTSSPGTCGERPGPAIPAGSAPWPPTARSSPTVRCRRCG